MKFNVGDKVKFMDQEGQGVVTKIINASTVGVTTDGFELPFSITGLIRIEKPSSTAERLFYEGTSVYGRPDKDKETKSATGKPAEKSKGKDNRGYIQEDLLPVEAVSRNENQEEDPAEDLRITPLKRGFASKHPQPEGVYIGIVPLDQQFMLRGPMEFYVINYTPYTLLYSLATRGAESFYGVDFASVPPYSKILVESIEREDIGLWTEGVLQCLFYQDESPSWLLPSSHDYKIRPHRFGQTENYIIPVFMREKTLLVPLLNLAGHKEENSLVHQNIFGEKQAEKNKDTGKNVSYDEADPLARYMIKKDTAEVDLHIENLLETRKELQGASQQDYLTKQLAVMETCLNQAIGQRLSKIIFIHGVGNGILKHEIEKRLRDYPGIHFMDASIARYGRGAIDVFIDTQK